MTNINRVLDDMIYKIKSERNKQKKIYDEKLLIRKKELEDKGFIVIDSYYDWKGCYIKIAGNGLTQAEEILL